MSGDLVYNSICISCRDSSIPPICLRCSDFSLIRWTQLLFPRGTLLSHCETILLTHPHFTSLRVSDIARAIIYQTVELYVDYLYPTVPTEDDLGGSKFYTERLFNYVSDSIALRYEKAV